LTRIAQCAIVFRMTHRTLQHTWGARVRAERQARDLTVLELSRRADVDPGNLSRFERGLQGASDDFRISLARGLGMEVAELFPYPEIKERPCPSAAPAAGVASSATPATTAANPSPAPSAAALAGSDREGSHGNE
jgi:transcriptional regulator with XRE-family HTH domain